MSFFKKVVKCCITVLLLLVTKASSFSTAVVPVSYAVLSNAIFKTLDCLLTFDH